MVNPKKNVADALCFLHSRIKRTPDILVLTGTGLGDWATGMVDTLRVDYRDIPHFSVPTVESHAGYLLLGQIRQRYVAVMMGRFHLYEGYRPDQVVFPIRVMQALGVKTMIVTNASGGLDPRFEPGDIMIIRDHINLTGENPLIGENIDAWGLRFPDMINAYDRMLSERVFSMGQSLGIPVHEGVYAGLKGPCLETPAEMRFLRIIGAKAVGFSTVQEVIAARHAGLRVLGLSVITNRCDPDHPEPATMEGVIAVARTAAPRLEILVQNVIEDLGTIA
ncbi:MAG: purine-nucleoside phosphorylase [Proteobacteria bacterium]|nr:purine-nucleoside phosphorylase [Pseudomonadota bacterium]